MVHKSTNVNGSRESRVTKCDPLSALSRGGERRGGQGDVVGDQTEVRTPVWTPGVSHRQVNEVSRCVILTDVQKRAAMLDKQSRNVDYNNRA